MKTEALRIIFMGTPEFAVPALDILVQNKCHIVAIITATDKFGGRGGKELIQSDIKKYALSRNIPILQPKNLKAPAFIDELKSYKADLQIVVAFRMLPEVVWNMPTMGTYNLHGSLLPKYRGAAPIHWAVINGETETGVTSFKLKHKIDTGDILLQEKITIAADEDTGSVYHRLKDLGAEVIWKTVKAIAAGNLQFEAQDASLVSKAPKLKRDNTVLNFTSTSQEVFNKIRGLSPFPVAWTQLDLKQAKIYKGSIVDHKYPYFPGTIVSDNKKYLHYCTQDGAIAIEELKLQGKKRMDIKSFLNGYEIKHLNKTPHFEIATNNLG